MYIQRDKIMDFFRPGVQELYVKNFGLTYEEANIAAEALISGVIRSIEPIEPMVISGNPDRFTKILTDKLTRLLPNADTDTCHNCRHKRTCRFAYEREKLQAAFSRHCIKDIKM